VKSGYDKIKRCCEVASMDGFEYVWVDTCCIDKTSSAELSEAINSMYRWYGQAEVCYTYLSDVPPGETIATPRLHGKRFLGDGISVQVGGLHVAGPVGWSDN
jgi:hypothetical protein